jgi:hypothetical protein
MQARMYARDRGRWHWSYKRWRQALRELIVVLALAKEIPHDAVGSKAAERRREAISEKDSHERRKLRLALCDQRGAGLEGALGRG